MLLEPQIHVIGWLYDLRLSIHDEVFFKLLTWKKKKKKKTPLTLAFLVQMYIMDSWLRNFNINFWDTAEFSSLGHRPLYRFRKRKWDGWVVVKHSTNSTQVAFYLQWYLKFSFETKQSQLKLISNCVQARIYLITH